MKTPEELLALATINPELDQIIKSAGPLPAIGADTDIFKLRANIAAVKAAAIKSGTPAQEEVSYLEEDRLITVRDGASIVVRIHRPKTPPKDGSPGFVLYHGGGWALGSPDNELGLCRDWTKLGGVAVNVDYRLAPEHPFPVPLNDAYDALKWTAAHVNDLNINPEKGFLVGGISAGANFAAVVSHLYRDEQISPPLTGVYLSIPATIEPEGLPEKYKNVFLSRAQNKDAPVLNAGTVDFFNGYYKADHTSPLRSPLLFPSHENLPPTYFVVCGLDPLRDESYIYEDALRQSGVSTRIAEYPGLPHGFWSFFPEAQFSKKFQEDSVEALRWLLNGSN